jgi:hypothetical protein
VKWERVKTSAQGKTAGFTGGFVFLLLVSIVVLGLPQVGVLIVLIQRLPAILPEILAVVVLAHAPTSPGLSSLASVSRGPGFYQRGAVRRRISA